MEFPVAYLTGNIVFISIGDRYKPEENASIKYMLASISSGIFVVEIFTKEEILKKYPNAKPVSNLLNLKEVYNTTK